MSWTVDRARTPKRKKNVSDSQSVVRNFKFDEYVSRKYQELLTSIEKEKTELRESMQSLLQEGETIESSTSRGLIRRKKQIQNEITKLREKLADHEKGLRLSEFKRKILPYSEAYERELQVNAVDKMRAVMQTSSLLPKDEDRGEKAAYTSGVMKEFMQEVENIPTEVKIMPNEICDECDDIMVLESRSSTLVCPCCGNWKYYLDATSSHMAYGEEVEFTAFAYLRMNHYNERLTYSQAKESTRIAIEDIQKVMDRLIERRITDLDKITMEMTYAIAKELKMRHVYKQNTQLWCRITGKAPLRMSPEQEEQLRSMFRAVNRLWPKYKPEERKNFLSYNYCLSKFCQLLGMDRFCGLYKLLKGDKKLEKQDEIFKQICDDPELQWEFIPSRHTD
jgi:hypothetical protein